MSRVGERIDAHCLKCGLVLAHIVLYEVNGQVSKVKCKTCGAEHKYRGVKAPPRKGESLVRRVPKEGRSRTGSASHTSPNPAPALWADRRRQMNPDTPLRDYRIRDTYTAGDVIHHPTFGVGFVQATPTDRRMEVLFQDEIRAMAMGVAGP